jgi:hypothetical protein
MAVLEHGKSRSPVQELVAAARRDVLVTVHGLEHVPSVVFSSSARGGLKIDLLPRVLAHLAHQEIASLTVEREAPWVAHAVCPDLGQRIRIANKRIVRWHRVIPSRIAREIVSIDVEAKDFAQPDLEILGVLSRVASGTAVAQTGV